jgi:hypothetical protein
LKLLDRFPAQPPQQFNYIQKGYNNVTFSAFDLNAFRSAAFRILTTSKKADVFYGMLVFKRNFLKITLRLSSSTLQEWNYIFGRAFLCGKPIIFWIKLLC